jgi:hypothetical protein
LQASALPLGDVARLPPRGPFQQRRLVRGSRLPVPALGGKNYGADDGIRTRDPNLGKVVLYQLSHVRTREAQAVGYQRRTGGATATRSVSRPRSGSASTGPERLRPGVWRARAGMIQYPSPRWLRGALRTTYGRLAQGESTSLTRKGSLVQIQQCPPCKQTRHLRKRGWRVLCVTAARHAQANSSSSSSMRASADCFVPSRVMELAVQLPCSGLRITSMKATKTV